MSIYQKLLEAKKEIGKVGKNAKNPHFKNTYADVNALIEAVEPILHEKGLMLLQPINDGKVSSIIIDCETSEQIESSIDLPTTGTPQAIGSAITYFRRYTLQSLLSLQAEDDDGQKASSPHPQLKPQIGDVAFGKAIERVANGEHDLISKLENTYALSTQQLNELNEAKGK